MAKDNRPPPDERSGRLPRRVPGAAGHSPGVFRRRRRYGRGNVQQAAHLVEFGVLVAIGADPGSAIAVDVERKHRAAGTVDDGFERADDRKIVAERHKWDFMFSKEIVDGVW